MQQSLSARESMWTTNGDGFGVAWYGKRTAPGVFKDILPAWNDANLRSLAAQIQTRLFFAHVRASTGTAVTRTNCHPFTWRNWAFMHNGRIGNWAECRKEVESLIDGEFYHHRQGTTDSEALFLLSLSRGLTNDPQAAIQSTLHDVARIMQRHRATEPLRISMAVTNGQDIWAVRCSSDDQSPTLYYGSPHTRASQETTQLAHTIASEPSDQDASHWQKVPERTGVHWSPEGLSVFKVTL